MDAPEPAFRAFDPEADVLKRDRVLPHWFQPGVAVFITFRTIDSLPRDVIVRMQRELEEWLSVRGLPVSLAAMMSGGVGVNEEALLEKMSSADVKVFRKFKDRLFHRSLDDCHGQCLLRNCDLAAIVAKSILHSNGTAYDLDSFVIMPNHVHAIAQFRAGCDLSIVGQSWMRFSARQINRTIGSAGAFWQPEPFDHLIRSDLQFQYLRRYIASNPEKANRAPGNFLYWNHDSGQPVSNDCPQS